MKSGKMGKIVVGGIVALFGIGGISAVANPQDDTQSAQVDIYSAEQREYSVGEQELLSEPIKTVEEERKSVVVPFETVREPVTEVVANGTYVYVQPTQPAQPSCPNGTYVNTAGNTVCRPASTNAGGATAICHDGEYSYSQSRRGTCSHHGGVRTWL